MNKKLIIPLVSILMLSLVLAVFLTNSFRSDLSDTFSDSSFNSTKFLNLSWTAGVCSGQGTCSVSFTENTKYIMSTSAGCGTGCAGTSASTNTSSKYNYWQSMKQWDIYFQFDGTVTVTQGAYAGSLSKYDFVLYDFVSGQKLSFLNLTRTNAQGGLSIPIQKWHLKILPDSHLAYLYNGSESLNTTITIPDHPLNWKNYTFLWQTYTQTNYDGGLGQANSNSMTFNVYNYSVFQTDLPYVISSAAYTTPAPETSTQNFDLSITTDPTQFNSLSDLKFYYDSVLYTPTADSLSDGASTLSTTLDLPAVSSTTNYNFYWNFTLNGPAGSINVQTDQYTQSDQNTIFQECNGTYTQHYLDISMYELGTFVPKNASLTMAIQYWLGSGSEFETLIYNNLNANQSTFDFCFSPTYPNVEVDGFINYYYTDPVSNDTYPNSRYYFTNSTLTNASTDLNLYMITDNSSELVTFRVIDTVNQPVPNAYVVVQAWDQLSDSFYTVNIGKTDIFGQTSMYIKRYTVWYQYQVLYNSGLYLQTEPLLETQLTRDLQIDLTVPNPYDEFNDISYSLSYNNNTGVVSFIWADTTTLLKSSCLQITNGGNTTNLNYECSASSSGTLTYTISQNGTFIARGIFIDTSDRYNIVSTIFINRGTPERFSVIGTTGIIGAFILIGTLAAIGIASGSVPLTLILTISGLVVSFILGAVHVNSATIWSIAAIAFIIVILSRRRNEY